MTKKTFITYSMLFLFAFTFAFAFATQTKAFDPSCCEEYCANMELGLTGHMVEVRRDIWECVADGSDPCDWTYPCGETGGG